jgi:hypothetical protein
MTRQTMTKHMQMSKIRFEASIPKPFIVNAAGVISPPVQACQVPNNYEAQPAGAPSGGGSVTNGAILQCLFGTAPGAFVVSPPGRSANIHDATPANIGSFGMCMSPANPGVGAATAAALGVLTPCACTPVTHCWDNGSGGDTLQPSATLLCRCGYGTISIVTSGS